MTDTGTGTGMAYEISTIPGGVDRELKRLRDQALMTWDKEARNLQWFGLKDGMTVLELGSGPGFITEALLELLPSSSVIALEIDPVMIEKAASYLEGRVDASRLTSIAGSIMQIDLPDNSVDFALGRFLFQHLPDPVGAAREVLRVLRPGGKLVIVDIDDDLHLFDPDGGPVIKAINDRYREKHEAKGGNRFIGRALPRVLRDAGFTEPKMEAVVVHNHEYGMENMMPRQGREGLQPELDAGLITEDELEAVLVAEDEAYLPDSITMLNIFMGCGTKP
jgi:ubiquinone/menaquinone biosynthesis C-methylase UbiE